MGKGSGIFFLCLGGSKKGNSFRFESHIRPTCNARGPTHAGQPLYWKRFLYILLATFFWGVSVWPIVRSTDIGEKENSFRIITLVSVAGCDCYLAPKNGIIEQRSRLILVIITLCSDKL